MLKWSCDGCKSYAQDSDWLVYQRDKLERVVLKDSDNISWIKCVNCKKRGHLKCISNVKEEQLSQIILPTLAAIVKFIKMQCSLLTRDILLATR